MQEIQPHDLYTAGEAQEILRVSTSTIKRMLRNGIIRANKVGKQYRILGKEILRLISPQLKEEAAQTYSGIKKVVKQKMVNW